MEVSNTLLVALMFVTILTLGIATALTSLSGYVKAGNKFRRNLFLIGWESFILIFYLLIFWQTSAIIKFDSWGFIGFLFVLTGPVLLFFTTNTLVNYSSMDNTPYKDGIILNRSFFSLLAIIQIWIVSTSFLLNNRFNIGDIFNFILFVISIILLISNSKQIHKAGLFFALLLLLTAILANGFNLFY